MQPKPNSLKKAREETTMKSMTRAELLNAHLIEIGADSSIEKCEAILDAEPNTREEVFIGIARNLTIGWGKTMGEILASADRNYEFPKHTGEHKCADNLIKLHNLLMLPDTLKSDEEIMETYKDFDIQLVFDWFEKIEGNDGKPVAIADAVAYATPELRARQWVFRCKGSDLIRQTEKAVCVDLGGEATAWIPKSVILEFIDGDGPSYPSGLIIKDWFAEKEARSGGPYCQINWEGKII